MGGLSVLRELRRLMPQEHYLFFGDSANAPYGVRSVEEVRALTMRRISELYDRGIKAAVIACNTATSAAVEHLRAAFADIPIIGMEPALKPAVLNHPGGQVLILATPLTLREEKFQHLLEQYRTQADIIGLPCPELVEFVERGELESEALQAYLSDRLGPYSETADAAVLGCTHFPFLREAISRGLHGRARLYDGGAGTARETRRQLLARGLDLPEGTEGSVTLENSRDCLKELELSRKLLNLP